MLEKRLTRVQTWISIFLIILAATLSACSPAASSPAATPSHQAARPADLTPYRSATPQAAAAATAMPLSTAAPTLTPTPRTHTVKRGEDMGGIAFLYRVSLEDLMAANPGVMPNLMSVGTVLIIPPSKSSQTNPDTQPDTSQPTPTAVPLEVGPLVCYRAEDGGVWCFLPVRNTQSMVLEGITAIVRLAGDQAEPVLSQPAFSLSDTLAEGAALPLVAYFPPDQVAALSPPLTYSAEIQSALPSADDGRYLPVRLEQQKVVVSENGLTANISVQAVLDMPDGSARRLWIAGVAYDDEGNVVGVRRWENAADRPLQSGQPLSVAFSIYSAAGTIERIELFAEARP